MAAQESTPPPALARDPFERLAARTQEIGYVLVGLGVVALVGALVVYFRFGADRLLFTVWAGALTVIFLGFGAYTLVRAAQVPGPGAADWPRLLAAFVGGLVGSVTALLGLFLPFTQPYKATFAGGLTEWRQHPGYLGVVGGALFGGLGLMFVSLQLTRPFERSRAELRRLVYGFNAVLGVLLLFLVLGLVNVLGYSNVQPFLSLGKTTDWTASSLYTLKDSSVNILQSLDRPVKLYVVMNTRTENAKEVLQDVDTLVENFRRVTEKVNFEVISPHTNRERMVDLIREYSYPADVPNGILVVYGQETHAPSFFVPEDKLLVSTKEGGRTFVGEGVLMNALDFLKAGKTKARIYFTQGHGEASLARGREERSLSALTQLGIANTELLPLNLSGADLKVPEDAAVVVVAGPRRKFSVAAAAALSRYYRGDQTPGGKKGKLFIMLDPFIQEGVMQETGLEGLLREQMVEVNKDRVFVADEELPPNILLAIGNPAVTNALARATVRNSPCLLVNSRSLTVMPPAGPGGPRVEPFLVPDPQLPLVWSETRLNVDPNAMIREAIKNGHPEATFAKLAQEHPVTVVGVTVAEAETPRMVVLGNSDWVTDNILRSPGTGNNLTLFRSSVNWLRGSADLGQAQVEGQARPPYIMKVTDAEMPRLEFLPLGLMLLGVVALGVSVWVVRRR